MRAPSLLLCGAGASATALAAALATQARVARAALPGARLTTAAAEAASAQQLEQAWRRLGSVDAVIIQTRLSTAPGRRNPGLGAWRSGIAASLRAAYVVARTAGLALARNGGGTLVIVSGPAAVDDPVAAVAAEGLDCLADGLSRALPAAVRVAAVSSSTSDGGAKPLARAVLALIGGVPPESPANVRFGAASRG